MKTTSKLYKIMDFINWSQNDQLITKPNYQRNLVWPEKAKSYLIDSLIRGYPIPHIFLFEEIDPKLMKTVREVVDGQQRVSTVLQFINDSFTIQKVHNEELANIHFKDFSDEDKQKILSYELPCQVFDTKDKSVIYDIFARLNTFNYALNSQELRNSQYFGTFKSMVEKIRLNIFDQLNELNLYKMEQIKRMKLQEDIARALMFYLDKSTADSDTNINKFYKDHDNDESENYTSIINDIIENYNKVIGIFKKITIFNGTLLSFDRKYFFTLFMLLKNIKNLDDNKIAKLAELDRRIFLTKTKNKKYLDEKSTLPNNMKLFCEHMIELHTQGTTDPNRKKQRVILIYKYIDNHE